MNNQMLMWESKLDTKLMFRRKKEKKRCWFQTDKVSNGKGQTHVDQAD